MPCFGSIVAVTEHQAKKRNAYNFRCARLIWIAEDYIVSKSDDSLVFSSSAALVVHINRAALLTPIVLVQLW